MRRAHQFLVVNGRAAVAASGARASPSSVQNNNSWYKLQFTASLYGNSSSSSSDGPRSQWFPLSFSVAGRYGGGVLAGAVSFSVLASDVYAKEPPPLDLLPKDVVLYQYEACPFCNKVKAFLDYYDIPYNVVEVNPISKKEIKWSDYKKVPILTVDGENFVDSSDIINKLNHKIHPVDTIPDDDTEENKWRRWVDNHLVHVLSPNIYRNPSEALESFDYITSHASGKQRNLADEILKAGNGNISAHIFTFSQLATATQNFNSDCLLGEGGFGRVYKGQIDNITQEVAVKQLDRNGLQGTREFLVEVLMLSLLHHSNLVNLIGFCSDGDQRILVYEYMPLGSLEDHLLDTSSNKKPLDWSTRMKIAQGAAKGLEYLHDTASPPVIYRDFKASNILLDAEFNPKLSDFGLAKLGPTGDKTHVSTRVMGTYGYCAPEYAKTGQLTTMSDVYSFGVVFLEIITGRRVIDTARPADEQNLVNWAQPLFRDKRKFTQMADPLLDGNYPLKGLYQALAVAAMCLQEEASTRPLMSDVVTALEYLTVGKTDEEDTNDATSELQ